MGKKPETMKSGKNTVAYMATIVPLGGAPYDVEVNVKEDGTIEYEGRQWVVSPNSTWISASKRRVILPEALSESLSSSPLTGKTYLNCRLFLLFMKMNLLEQLFRLQSQKPWFKQSSTWIIAGSLLLVALILIWNVIAIDGAISALGDRFNEIGFGNEKPQDQGNTTHNPIAPGEN